MSELEIKANAEQYALKRITSTDLSIQARDKILIQDAYEKGFNDCYAMAREENGIEWHGNEEPKEHKEIIMTIRPDEIEAEIGIMAQQITELLEFVDLREFDSTEAISKLGDAHSLLDDIESAIRAKIKEGEA